MDDFATAVDEPRRAAVVRSWPGMTENTAKPVATIDSGQTVVIDLTEFLRESRRRRRERTEPPDSGPFPWAMILVILGGVVASAALAIMLYAFAGLILFGVAITAVSLAIMKTASPGKP